MRGTFKRFALAATASFLFGAALEAAPIIDLPPRSVDDGVLDSRNSIVSPAQDQDSESRIAASIPDGGTSFVEIAATDFDDGTSFVELATTDFDGGTPFGPDGGTSFIEVAATPVHEPTTLLLLGVGLASLGLIFRRRRKSRIHALPSTPYETDC